MTADEPHLSFLLENDKLDPSELRSVLAAARVLVVEVHGRPVGWLRWGLFWDTVPFMNLIHVLPQHRGQGYARLMIEGWEDRCRARGSKLVMTSTLSDETAQHLYRRLGYRDCGCLLTPGEALEIFMMKRLSG